MINISVIHLYHSSLSSISIIHLYPLHHDCPSSRNRNWNIRLFITFLGNVYYIPGVERDFFHTISFFLTFLTFPMWSESESASSEVTHSLVFLLTQKICYKFTNNVLFVISKIFLLLLSVIITSYQEMILGHSEIYILYDILHQCQERGIVSVLYDLCWKPVYCGPNELLRLDWGP